MESRRDKDLSWREDKWWWLVRVPQVKSILGSVSPPRDSGGLVRLSEAYQQHFSHLGKSLAFEKAILGLDGKDDFQISATG